MLFSKFFEFSLSVCRIIPLLFFSFLVYRFLLLKVCFSSENEISYRFLKLTFE